jgi:CheY-like chemotaxis protein
MIFNASLRQFRILCVDDDLICLNTRASVLEAVGYLVTAVSRPLTALEYDLSKFDLAIVDFDMPELNGFQLLLHLRAAHAAFPIVLLSGLSKDLPHDTRRVFSCCLDKGEPVQHLLNTVSSYLTAIPDPPECREWVSSAHPVYR